VTAGNLEKLLKNVQFSDDADVDLLEVGAEVIPEVEGEGRAACSCACLVF